MSDSVPRRDRKLNPWRWWALTIFAALTFFVHDALMAIDAHAADAPMAHYDAHHRLASHETAIRGDDVAGPFVPGHQPQRSDTCDVARPIVQPNDSESDTIAQAATTVPIATSEVPLARLTRPPWVEPTAPPGTRRALFQVFLI
jgi:hypothetical protein